MTARSIPNVLLSLVLLTIASVAQPDTKSIHLPTSKVLTRPGMGRLAFVNSFPGTIATTPNGHYAALLNYGYGTQDSRGHQSITILDLEKNSMQDFPDGRLGTDAHQSYFVGLAFSSDGKHLYASMGSITDPTGKRAGDTGNGIAVYTFSDGKLTPERFIKIGPQPLARGKYIARGLFRLGPGHAIPYPAGLAVIAGQNGDRLLVANNYSDNVVLLDAATGELLKSFDVSTNKLVPSAFPYAVVATRD